MKLRYDCSKCPAYCCSYDEIAVSKFDLRRLAKHFGLEEQVAKKRFTKISDGQVVLRHKKDKIFGTVCMFLDSKTRRCTVYDARPKVCKAYPEFPTCGYYEFLTWERRQQGDDEFI